MGASSATCPTLSRSRKGYNPFMGRQRSSSDDLPNLPWLTEEGINFSKVPLDLVARQALAPTIEEVRGACGVLAQIACVGRLDADVYLIGLLRYYQDHPERRRAVVNALGLSTSAAAADALADEFRRVESSNTTRTYLNSVLKALSRMGPELAVPRLEALAEEPGFSARMRTKFRETAMRIEWEASGG